MTFTLVHSRYTGACLGRVVGIGMKLLAVATGGALLDPAGRSVWSDDLV